MQNNPRETFFPHLDLNSIQKIEFKNSEIVPEIQMADIYASSYNQAFSKYKTEIKSQEERDLHNYIRGQVRELTQGPGSYFVNLIISDDYKNAIS
jgi:hypothetical protein